jgi:hypothetical protein
MSNKARDGMNELPQLVISQNGDKQIAYCCSVCRKKFDLREDRSPKEAVTIIWSEFKQHVQENHPAMSA